MKKYKFVILGIFYAVFAYGQSDTSTNTCVTCHVELDSLLANPVKQMQTSAHQNPQISCQGCHGGDPTQEDPDLSMSVAKGFKGKPTSFETPQLCANCHSNVTFMRNFDPNFPVDQYDRYLTSQHGLLLAKGDTKVATCTNCHGIHDIKKVKDPTAPVYPTNLATLCKQCHSDPDYMTGYSIGTDQYDEYKTSIHAIMLYEKGDLSAPTCNDCHGNHGAVPPGITSIANICGTCHYVQSEYFSASPHKSAFDELGLSECEACHGNHAVQPAAEVVLGTEEPAICIQCHEENSIGFNNAAQMHKAIESLENKISSAEELLLKAQRAGVEIKDEKLNLPNAKDALIQAKTLIHTFSTDKVESSTDKGLEAANNAVEIGQLALKEVGNRKKMLVIMVVLTLLVASLLVFYIRGSEKSRS